MTRTTEQRLRHQRERAEQKAKRERLEQADKAWELHGANASARAASPRNILAEQAGRWNHYMHLPVIWCDLAKKQLYEVTADEVATLLAQTIRAAEMDKMGEQYQETAAQLVARRALPLAAEFEARWREYWRDQS